MGELEPGQDSQLGSWEEPAPLLQEHLQTLYCGQAELKLKSAWDLSRSHTTFIRTPVSRSLIPQIHIKYIMPMIKFKNCESLKRRQR